MGANYLEANNALGDKDFLMRIAHSHLGTLAFQRSPGEALRHYRVGVRIGESSLGPQFDDGCSISESGQSPDGAAV